jgi:hypothetical protein
MLHFLWYVFISGCPYPIPYDMLRITIRIIYYEFAKLIICYEFTKCVISYEFEKHTICNEFTQRMICYEFANV